VKATEILQAMAVASGYSNSFASGGAYTVTSPAATPAASPSSSSTYTAPFAVTLTDATAGAAIYYTTNATTPTTSSALYTGPFTIRPDTEVQVLAVASGYTNSRVLVANYYAPKAAATPAASPSSSSTYSAPFSVTLTDATAGTAIYYTTNATTPTTSSALYTGPFTIKPNTEVQAIAVASGYTNSAVLVANYYAPKVAATPAASPSSSSTYSAPFSVMLTDATAGAAIYYTTNATTPTTSSTLYTAPFTIKPNTEVQAIAVASGYTNSAVIVANYYAPTTAMPTFSTAGGSYSTPQTVTLSDTTSGAVIYYTTNGASPTNSSTRYTGPITVSATETIRAIAVASGYNASAAATTVYTLP
jgi:hypothetical protein